MSPRPRPPTTKGISQKAVCRKRTTISYSSLQPPVANGAPSSLLAHTWHTCQSPMLIISLLQLMLTHTRNCISKPLSSSGLKIPCPVTLNGLYPKRNKLFLFHPVSSPVWLRCYFLTKEGILVVNSSYTRVFSTKFKMEFEWIFTSSRVGLLAACLSLRAQLFKKYRGHFKDKSTH